MEQALYYITSDKDTHFTGALAQHAMETESIDFHSDLQNLKIDELVIESISIQSDQNLEWDVILWNTSDFDDTDLDTDKFIDFFNFATTGGKQVAGANQFYYAAPSNFMKIPYVDTDRSQKLHIGLVNKSATSKNAGATGEVVVKLAVRPVWGV